MYGLFCLSLLYTCEGVRGGRSGVKGGGVKGGLGGSVS